MAIEQSLLIDSHAHLDSEQYDHDRNEMIERAKQNGVSHILTIGCDIKSSQDSIAIAEQYDHIFAAVGVHPHDAIEICSETLDKLKKMLGHPKVVALGEIGLDYYRDRSPRDIQQQAFRKQIRLAIKSKKPIIVHDRDAHEDVLRILEEENAAETGGVLHCFSGDLAMAQKCLDLGFYLSFPGPITYPKNEQTREIVKALPMNRILVETDCPYLSPQKFRGKRNEPAYVRYTAEKIAEIKAISIEDVARITSRNCHDLFGIGQIDQKSMIAYKIRNSLYLNITNRCTNQCVFCAKFADCIVKGHELKLDKEPTFTELIAAINDPRKYDEVVFCGFGEPLLRLDVIIQVARWLKNKRVRVRVNTDGLANLVYERNILPELAGLIDAMSISLNAADADTYQKICRSPYGKDSFQAMKDFIVLAKNYIPDITATAVSYPGVDIPACEQTAKDLGIKFRMRQYNKSN